VTHLKRMPSECDLAESDWVVLTAYDTVFNEMQHNVCKKCSDRMTAKPKRCFYCGEEYVEERAKGGNQNVSSERMKQLISTGRDPDAQREPSAGARALAGPG